MRTTKLNKTILVLLSLAVTIVRMWLTGFQSQGWDLGLHIVTSESKSYDEASSDHGTSFLNEHLLYKYYFSFFLLTCFFKHLVLFCVSNTEIFLNESHKQLISFSFEIKTVKSNDLPLGAPSKPSGDSRSQKGLQLVRYLRYRLASAAVEDDTS